MDGKDLEVVQDLWDKFDELVCVVDSDNRCHALVIDTDKTKQLRQRLRLIGVKIEGVM